MTSPVLNQLQHYVRNSSRSRQWLKSSQYEEKRGFGHDASPPFKQSEATLIESPLRSIPVGICPVEENPFTHFLDGIQRSWLLYHCESIPVYYGYTAAVIRQRFDRVLSTWQHDRKEALYVPFAWCEELEEFQRLHLPIVNTLTLEEEPFALLEKARTAITQARQQQEASLAEAWINQGLPGWLVIDGSITISPQIASTPKVVGLIKSHHTQYFSFTEQKIIHNLAYGERSSTFSPASRHNVCSWYLRLREARGEDIHFGLIRVEVALQLRSLADAISRWILTECRPLSLPDSRWDRMIYPIRDCELFLRSQEPSPAALGWLI